MGRNRGIRKFKKGLIMPHAATSDHEKLNPDY
jgi:hypothetical protein